MTNEKPGLMTGEEMRTRLHKGENAIELSVEKWRRIVQWHIKSGGMPDRELLKANSCALCERYYDGAYDALGNECEYCPYMIKYGIDCKDEDGHYKKYMHEPSEKTAREMYDALAALGGSFSFFILILYYIFFLVYVMHI